MSDRIVLYFGCLGHPGHYLHGPRGSTSQELANYAHEKKLPWTAPQLDSEFLEETIEGQYQPEGIATTVWRADWSALAFWDRSGDHRHNSRSVFLVHGQWGFEDLVRFAREAFPEIWARFSFEVRLPR